MDYHSLALQSAWTNSRSNLGGPKYWMVGIAFLATYFTLNIVTERYQIEGLGITLWSPDDGLSVLLLMEGTKFAPFVLVGSVLVDVLISRVRSQYLRDCSGRIGIDARLRWIRHRLAGCFEVQPKADQPRRRDFNAGGGSGRRNADLADLLRNTVSHWFIARRPVYLRAAPFLDRRHRRNHCDHCGGVIGVHSVVESALGLAKR